MLLKTIAVILFSFETRPFSQHVNAQKTNRLGSNSVSVLKDSKAGNKTSHIWWATGAIRPGVFPQRNVPGSFPVAAGELLYKGICEPAISAQRGWRSELIQHYPVPKSPKNWFQWDDSERSWTCFFFSKKKQEHSKICLRLFLCIGKLLSEQQKLQVFRETLIFLRSGWWPESACKEELLG